MVTRTKSRNIFRKTYRGQKFFQQKGVRNISGGEGGSISYQGQHHFLCTTSYRGNFTTTNISLGRHFSRRKLHSDINLHWRYLGDLNIRYASNILFWGVVTFFQPSMGIKMHRENNWLSECYWEILTIISQKTLLRRPSVVIKLTLFRHYWTSESTSSCVTEETICYKISRKLINFCKCFNYPLRTGRIHYIPESVWFMRYGCAKFSFTTLGTCCCHFGY